MFERFTDRARRVVVLAQDIAREQHSKDIQVEHLLHSLAREGEGVAAQVLISMGITADAIKPLLTRREEPAPSGHIPFTPRSKKILELSLREALQLGHNYIGTEHLLLAIIREGESGAIEILSQLGVTKGDLREAVITKLNGYKKVEEAEEAKKVAAAPDAFAIAEWLDGLADQGLGISDLRTLARTIRSGAWRL